MSENIENINGEELDYMEEELHPMEVKKVKWGTFVESALVDFFAAHKLEKLAVEDGNGNKAKLSVTKDNGIKVELSSISII